MSPSVPFLRADIDPAALPQREGIVQYLAAGRLEGDNGKYMKLYDRLAPLYDIGEKLADRFRYGRSIAAMRRAMMALPEWQNGASVLYVSIGTGSDLAFLLAHTDLQSLNLVGADLSFGMLRRARRKWQNLSNLSLIQCAAEDFPFADNSFDIVFHVGGINFFSDKARALAEMFRVAKPGTLLMAADETQDLVDSQYKRHIFTKTPSATRKSICPP